LCCYLIPILLCIYEGRSSQTGTFNFTIIKRGASVAVLHVIEGVQLKSGPILIWVIYLLRFTTCYITQLTCIYSKCWKWCPSISIHLSLVLTLTSAYYDSCPKVNLFHGIFFNHFRNSTFYWRLPSKFFKETLSTVGVRHRF